MAKKQKTRKQAKQLDESAKTVQKVYRQAIGVYESALDSLQNKNFSKAHEQFQEIIDRFPEERELHDRCYLYLRVCQRASNVPVIPKTFDELIFSATIKINAGNQKEALRHLEQAMAQNPNNDEVHYITALALAASGDITAINYLQRAIDLNSDNRFIARQETGFELLQENDDFQKVLELPITPSTGE